MSPPVDATPESPTPPRPLPSLVPPPVTDVAPEPSRFAPTAEPSPKLPNRSNNSFSKPPPQFSRQNSARQDSGIPLPGGLSRRSSAILGSVRGILGRSQHRKYRSRAGSVAGSAVEWSSQLEPGETSSFVPSVSRRPSEIPELEEGQNLLDADSDTARLRSNRSVWGIPRIGLTRKALVGAVHSLKQRAWGGGVKTLRWEKKTAILASKVGFTCCLASLLIVVEPLRKIFQGFGVWAVITAALVYESNIGTSLNKGFNRIMGTVIAGGLALAVNRTAPLLGAFEPYFVLLSIFTTTWIPVYLRFSSPLKDQWNYACSMATITAHLLILGGYKQAGEAIKMPMARFLTIVGGFVLAAVVNLMVKPNFAGDNLHALVSKNFKTAADVAEKCVEEYAKGTELDPVPEILAGKKIEDQLHSLYHGIVMSESEVDKMMGVISWEPRHGKFTGRYPWELYGDVTDNLRYTVYVIISLDSCLRAEIQAPKLLRDIFAQEMTMVGKEIGNVLRLLHRSLKDMRRFALHEALQQAEIAALRLQMRLFDNAHRLLMDRDAPKNDIEGLSKPGEKQFVGGVNREDEEVRGADVGVFQESPKKGEESSRSSPERTGKESRAACGENEREWAKGLRDVGDLRSGDLRAVDLGKSGGDSPGRYSCFNGGGNAVGGDESEECSDSGSDQTSEDGSEAVLLLSRQRLAEASEGYTGGGNRAQMGGGDNPGLRTGFVDNYADTHYDGTLERVCAMSLVKFASTLIECVAGLRFLVESVEALGERAGFEDPEKGPGEGLNREEWAG
ncbi:Aluminium activated malate transporter family protein [Klebsormidium nitens]|uniref:Aluminium activated malate transporter family protein n=1 Tax=Klebsormidium nitens TaxID=105231 RepID=A0A1Y1HXE2_KLENI|nr:Aluminium activated malate transporter family protein [Klebsormidium nitens]|eukprot:GAQ81186.1 Aluminium activated malate transporter family protein [Klebsormidium nitens]